LAERRLELLYIRVEGNDQVKTPGDVGRICYSLAHCHR